jgi:lipopolysaccharide export system protein LptC
VNPGLALALRLWRATWERLTLYLPMALMGVLALGTYWLVRSTPVFEPPAPEKPKRHEADYVVSNFGLKTYDANGRLKSDITGQTARHYPDTDTLEIDQVRIRSVNDRGHVTVASANMAVTNSDSSEVQLIGNALVVREGREVRGEEVPRMQFKGEFLHAFLDTERVKSHKPVDLQRGQDVFTADTLDFDNVTSVMALQGRVRGTLVPKPEKPEAKAKKP